MEMMERGGQGATVLLGEALPVSGSRTSPVRERTMK
jgi:hypothetical protein